MEASSFSRRSPGHAYDFLPPDRAARQPRASARPADISDAEFVVIGGRQSQAFNAKSFNDNRKQQAAAVRKAEPSKAFSAAAGIARGVEEHLQQASFKSFTALVFLLFLLVFGLSGGFSGLQAEDQSAAGSPLHFTHVTLTPRDANGMRILMINGILENESGTTQTVRPIRADLVSDGRLTASIVINPPADVIYGGESRGFSARVQHSGGKMPEVRLSFMP
ncbi:hypothetical protein [Rhizobium sp. OAE497]|uniref:hypothetical protein n=1 Tax=Rhizobium sp. OAE497 TaxID=2663796 RepID=UPI0018F62A34